MMWLNPALLTTTVIILGLTGCAREDGGAPVEICHGRPQHQLKSIKRTPPQPETSEPENRYASRSDNEGDASPEEKSGRPKDMPAFVTPIDESLYREARKAYTQDGVLIPVKKGTAFVAIEGGAVIFAGSDVELGNAVIIRHANEWISVYSHAKSLNVSTGGIVKKGQLLGHTGQSGKATEPQLHLEVRQNNKIVSPRRIF